LSESGGHWNTLAEAQKLTQSLKIPGVVEEDIKRNNPIDLVPVAQGRGTGLKIEWLREQVVVDSDVVETEAGSQLSWSEDVTYEEKETQLRRLYIQRKLDHFVEGIYGTYNNYEAQMLLESEKGLKRKLGSRFIYADTTYGGTPTQFDGLHALAAEHGTAYTAGSAYDPKNIDGGEAGLALSLLRVLIDEMKLGVDILLMPFEIVRRISAAYQETGFAGLATATAGNMSFISMGFNDIGKRILYWDGIPIMRTDYLVAEEANTGTGASSNARALYSSDKQYSIFAIKWGNPDLGGVTNPGLIYAYGGTEGAGDLYKLVRFPELEDYDAGGIRLLHYGTPLMKSSMGLGRIWDIEDVAITV
jgi:hypothetical protein